MGFFEQLIEADGPAEGSDEQLFYENLTGEAATDGWRAGAPDGYGWARRVFDDVARTASPPGSVVAGASDGAVWTVVAPPGSSTPDSIRSGDLVIRRGRRVSLLVVDATVATPDLFGSDGRVRPDTLVVRADSGVPMPVPADAPYPMPEPVELPYPVAEPREPEEEDYAEVVPTFAVGAPDARPREFVEMPVHYEDWIPNAAGTGLVMVQFKCQTQVELDATLPFAAGAIASTPTLLWKPNAAGKMQADLDLLIFHPATAAGATTLPAGRHPLAIICMGNHEVVDDANKEICSHHGYSGFSPSPPAEGTGPYLQEALAENGIISVSVSTNGANLLGLFIETRANFVVAALRKMQQLDAAPGRYHRKIDFQRVAFVGHSRGGDAVVRATRLAPSNTRVRAVVQIAPTDITGLVQGSAPPPPTMPAGAPKPTFVTRPITLPESRAPRQLLIWGSRDGDVSGFGDVRSDRFASPFRHYDRSAIERAFQFWHGATHNRFNRLWKDKEEDRACKSRIKDNPAGLLSRAGHEARTIEMVRGWLNFSLHDEVAEAGKFDGRTPTTVETNRAIAGMWKFGRRVLTIDQFDDVRPDRNTLGAANVTPATGVFDEITVANENAAGAGTRTFQFMHIDRALRYSPAPLVQLQPAVPLPTTVSRPIWRTTIPAGRRNFRGFDLMTFRVTKKYDPEELKPAARRRTGVPAAKLPEVFIRLIGRSTSVSHTEPAGGLLSTLPILRILPKRSGFFCPNFVADLTKFHYETWQVELSKFAAAMSIADVHFVEIEIETPVGQPVYIDTLSLVKRP